MADGTRRRVGSVMQVEGGRWRARVTCGVREDGRPRRASRNFSSKSEAEAWLVAQSALMGERADLGAGVTLRRLWKLYEGGRRDELSPKTMSAYRSQMRTWLAAMGDADVTSIGPAEVQPVLSGLTHENALHAKRALSSVLTYGVRVGLLKSNPLHGHRFEMPERADEGKADWDADPFAAIEGIRDVWDVTTVMRCMGMIRGLPLEAAWLACVGAGLRVEEALALRAVDVRRVEVAGVEVTQLAVHAASTPMERRKATKTRQSVRVVAMLEPFGERYFELAREVGGTEAVCAISPGRQNKAWRGYFEDPPTSKHTPKSTTNRGALHGLPYLPLSKMRNTHATLMQQAGVLDSINAAMHGHTEAVSRRHYLRPDTTEATVRASRALRFVG